MSAALVTGAGRRLGRAIALGLAADGYAVGVHHHVSAAGAAEVVAEIEAGGGRAVALPYDLTDATGCGVLVERAVAALGPLSVLVNSASDFGKDSLGGLTAESWRRLVDVNLTAPVFLMQAFAAQEPVPDGAAIVNLLDTQTTSPSPIRFSYFTGKFGLEGATRLAAVDLAAEGIRVNAVAPGLVLPSEQSPRTFAARQQLTPLGEGLGTDDVVDAVRYLIGAKQVTGQVLVVDAGQRLMGFGNTPAG
ncbi:MAG: SDR family oxidoreductase [Alphaproteobacteria bacterium]